MTRTPIPFRPASASLDQSAGGAEFTSLAKNLMVARGVISDAILEAERVRAPERVQRILRDASAGMATSFLSPPPWGPELTDYKTVANGFLEALRGVAVFDTLLAGGMRVLPLRTRLTITTVGATGAAVGEGNIKPVTELELSNEAIEVQKAGAIIVVSDELARMAGSAAMQTIARQLRSGVASATDGVFVASLVAGAVPTPSSGATAANILTDLGVLLDAVQTWAGSRLYLLVPPEATKHLGLKTSGGVFAFPNVGPTGGQILPGVLAIACDALADSGNVVLVDATGIAGASEGITLDGSKEATLDMNGSTSPDTSLWQRGLSAIRAEGYFGFVKLHGAAVAALDHVEW